MNWTDRLSPRCRRRMLRCCGNVRRAPFRLTPVVVKDVLEPGASPVAGVVDVPIEPIKLVDRPRPSGGPADRGKMYLVGDGEPELPLADCGPLKIDLNAVPSAMEQAAAKWRRPPTPDPKAQQARAAGKVWCGPCSLYVPANFGDGCLTANCPLRGDT